MKVYRSSVGVGLDNWLLIAASINWIVADAMSRADHMRDSDMVIALCDLIFTISPV